MGSPRVQPYDTVGGLSRSALCHLQFVAGASGAVPTYPGSFARSSEAVAAVSKPAGTGIYRVALAETYFNIGALTVTTLQASFATTGAYEWTFTTDNVANGLATTPYFEITFRTVAGAAVDLASGDTVYMSFDLKYRG